MYFGGWRDWEGGGGMMAPPPPPWDLGRGSRDRREICTMVVCDVIYKTLDLDFPK